MYFRHPEAAPLPGDTILQRPHGGLLTELTALHSDDHGAKRNRTPTSATLIGWTPLIRLNRVTRGIRTPVYAKAEFFNPGGSIKDRIGGPIIEQAEREGRLKPGGTIVEGTSGNTGIGLAIAAAFKGYKCIFTMPDKMSQEKVRLLKAFGAEVIVTPTAVPPDHPDNYVMMAKRIAAETPNAILADQFYNDANPEGALRHDGPRRSGSRPKAASRISCSPRAPAAPSPGSGATSRKRNPKIKIIAGDPVGSILAEMWRTKGKGQAGRAFRTRSKALDRTRFRARST